jgi:hypothetical protein
MKMSTNYKSVLALIAAAAVCANSSPAGEDAQPRDLEVQKFPVRWKLALNASRPTAILGVERRPVAATSPAATEKIGQTVFSIPDILCASSPVRDKQTAYNLEDTVAASLDDLQKPGRAKVNAPGGPVVRVHAQAGILVFSGTWAETELVRSTLQALKDTAQERKAAALDRELRAKDAAARN